jgi:hypothetical protein
MNRKKFIIIFTVGMLALVGAFGAAAYYVDSAAASTLAVPIASAAAHLGQGIEDGTVNEEFLAEALGITVDELQAAKKEAYQAGIDQALEAGLITQVQADELSEKDTTFPFARRWSGWLSEHGIDYKALLAEALGISVEQLEEAYAQAFIARIDQAVVDGKLTEEQAELVKGRYALSHNENFQTAIQSAFEAAVKQAVEEGVITQAQADLILEKLAERDGFGFGLPGLDGRRGFGGRGGHDRLGDFSTDTNP